MLRVGGSVLKALGVAAVVALLCGPVWSWIYFGYPWMAPGAPLEFHLKEVERAAWVERRGEVPAEIVPFPEYGPWTGREADRMKTWREAWGGSSPPPVDADDVDRLVAALGDPRSPDAPPHVLVGPVAVGRTFFGDDVLVAALRGGEVRNDPFPYAEVVLPLDGDGTADVERFFVDIAGLEGLDGATIAGAVLMLLGPALVLVVLIAHGVRALVRRRADAGSERTVATPS
ncbi:MAG: hypothetical protein ACF8XB_13300 [Planctomycetota bacterium JB042]